MITALDVNVLRLKTVLELSKMPGCTSRSSCGPCTSKPKPKPKATRKPAANSTRASCGSCRPKPKPAPKKRTTTKKQNQCRCMDYSSSDDSYSSYSSDFDSFTDSSFSDSSDYDYKSCSRRCRC